MMDRRREFPNRMAGVLIVCFAVGAVWPSSLLMANESAAARFVASLEGSTEFDAAAAQFVMEQWQKRSADDDTEGFLLEALSLLNERFRSGMDAYDEGQYRKCVEVMDALSDDLNAHVGANAAVMAVKALVAAEDLVAAETRIAALLALPERIAQYTDMAAEVYYMKGYCELGNLKRAEAKASFLSFLEAFPDAPQRLRVTAQQILAEVGNFVREGMAEVTDLMDFSARRLGSEDPGEQTQVAQERVVTLLDKLIEEAENRENQGGGGGSNSGSNQTRRPSSPMQDSRLPSGGQKQSSLADRRVVKPGEVWGQMQPEQRERVLQALKASFPDRYRQLVEQYYQQLAEEP